MFTLCECFEGKHKAATQWVDYKLGLSFKQTEFINTEFPHTPLAGLSLCAYICGSNTHTHRDTHTMALLAFWSLSVGAWACIVFAPTCALSLVCFHISCPFLSADSVSLTVEEGWTDICNGEKSVNEHTHWWESKCWCCRFDADITGNSIIFCGMMSCVLIKGGFREPSHRLFA